MSKPLDAAYWRDRLGQLKAALESNLFEAFLAETPAEARDIVMGPILASTGARRISWGGSRTVADTGLPGALAGDPSLEFLNPFEGGLSPEESLERRREALAVDLFISGTNALTEGGQLVNLDRTGNRVAALGFGPKFVAVLAGRNKVVPDLSAAFARIRGRAAPLVAAMVRAKTPCVRTSRCEDCNGPGRVCNTWGIIERSYPQGRIKVVLINGDMGF